jgi:hypothetical protein
MTAVVESQLRTVPPYLVAIVWALITCYISLRIKQRAGPILVSGVFMVLGYAIAGELSFLLRTMSHANKKLSVGTKNSHAR